MPVPFPLFPHLRPPLLRCALLLCALLLAACTRPNPDFCCSSEAECADLGVSELRTCSTGRVCDSNVCRDVQCESAEQCGAEAPYCANQVCKATCAGDGDCIGAPGGPLCADDGVCVGCKSNDDCGEEAPICSPTKRVCSPCRADADCASGVCLAADGVCAKSGELLYVSQSGTDGTGCTKNQPCRTVNAALNSVSALRAVIRLVGSSYQYTDEISITSKNVYIDGENTDLVRAGSGPLIRINGTSRVTIEGLKFSVRSENPEAITVASPETTRLSQLNVSNAGSTTAMLLTAGTTQITDSDFNEIWIQCVSSATVYLESSNMRGGAVDGGSTCSAYVRQNILNDVRVTMESGLVFENNLYISSSPTCRANIYGNSGLNKFDFNTFVCRHNPPVTDPNEGGIFGCTSDTNPTGNIFAWDSIHPIGNCLSEYNIFPSFVPVSGKNNIYTDIPGVFVDYLNGDFHLSASSPAHGAGKELEDIDVDLEGNPRPNPKGSKPDIGAFEAP